MADGRPIIDLAADDGPSLAPDGSLRVERCANRGTGEDAVQAIALKQPLLVTGVNGLPALAFDGRDDCVRIPSIDFDGADKITGAVVGYRAPTDQPAILLEGSAGEGSARIFALNINTTEPDQLEVRSIGPLVENGGAFTEDFQTPRTIIFTIDRSIVGATGTPEMRVWLDGVEQDPLTQIGDDDTLGAFDNLSLSIGARYDGRSLAFCGHLQQVRIYPRLLTDPQIASLDTYLAQRWRRWESVAAELDPSPDQEVFGVEYPTPALALAALNAVNGLLRESSPSTFSGGTTSYPYLRKNINTGAKALVIDDAVRALHGRLPRRAVNQWPDPTVYPERLNFATETALDVHTWGSDPDTWPS